MMAGKHTQTLNRQLGERDITCQFVEVCRVIARLESTNRTSLNWFKHIRTGMAQRRSVRYVSQSNSVFPGYRTLYLLGGNRLYNHDCILFYFFVGWIVTL